MLECHENFNGELCIWVIEVSEPVPPTNSDTSRDKYKGLSMTGRGDAEVLRTWLQCMCCALAIPASLYFGGLRDRVTEADKGRSCQKAEEAEEDRGEFAGSIQDDIQTEGQSPQHVEYLYFTLDMYSNREAEEKHSEDIAKSLQMTNR